MYGHETMLWKERSRIRAVQIHNLSGLFGIGIKKMDRILKLNPEDKEVVQIDKGGRWKDIEGVLGGKAIWRG